MLFYICYGILEFGILDVLSRYREKAWRQLHKNATSNIEQVLEAALHEAAAVRPPTTHQDNYQS